MKKLILILMIYSSIYQIKGQANQYKILQENLGSQWETSRHIMYPDNLNNPSINNIIVSTEIKSGVSVIRIQCSQIATPYVQVYDEYLGGFYDKETAIAFEADNSTLQYVLAGNTVDNNNKAKGFLAQINRTNGAIGSQIELNINDPVGDPFDHTFILDMKIDNIEENVYGVELHNYYIVGYIADGLDSRTSLKKPFVACYDNALNFLWAHVYDNADVDNNFSSIELCSTYNFNILVSGCTKEWASGLGVQTRMVTSVLFNALGIEIAHNSYYGHGASTASDVDHSRVADLLYQHNPAAATPIDPSVVILSFNDIDKAITLSRLDLATMSVASIASSYAVYPGSGQFDCVGFEVMNIDIESNLAVVGYDYSAPLSSITNPNAKFTFISYHDPNTLLSNNYTNFDIDNTGYENLSIDPYFLPLGASFTAPDAFYPSMAYNDGTSIFIGSSRYRILTGGYHNSVVNNYDYNNATQHCVIHTCNFNLNTFSTFQNPMIPHLIMTTTNDANVTTNAIDIGQGMTPLLTCPAYGSFKTSGTDLIQELNQIILYPNPTHDYLNIKVPNDEKLQYEIYSIEGKEYNGEIIQSNLDQTIIDVRKLTGGVYFLKCYNSESNLISNTKFIKQ